MNIKSYSKSQLNILVLLRILIGWHFLYEGVLKVYNPEWTAEGYLMSSQGIFRPFFQWLASDGLIGIVDAANIVILLFVGIALIAGILERPAAFAGFVLLFLYYLAHPAFSGLDQGPVEGNYWLVNKNLIEGVALLALYYFPTSEAFGLKRLFGKKEKELANV
ncbi:MAG: DoxX family protein [Cyclobacteriaceae bacterium]